MATVLQILNKEVSKILSTYKLSEGKSFGMWLCREYLELDESDSFEAASIDGGNDKGIDLFWVDDSTQRVIIGQLKFNRQGKYKATKNELLGLIHTTDWLKDIEDSSRQGRKELTAAAKDYNTAISNGFSIEYIYAFCGPPERDVSDTARQFNASESGNVPSRYCKILDLNTLTEIHEEAINQSARVSSCSIELPTFLEESGPYGDAIVTTLKAAQLHALYEQHGDRLFDRNVRLFLGARKGGVNAGIRATLDSTAERKNFWAYNNGITIICDDFNISNNKDEITLSNFSIVNGCQTTVSLSNEPINKLKDVRVLVRFIKSTEKIIDSIITFNNSQNPIRLWDLNSQDKLQKKLKKDLANLAKPFLYVLRKGEVQKLSDAERNKFKRDGKIQQIPHDQCAQFLAAFKGLPAIGYKDKGRIFSTYKDEIFPSQIRAEEIILAWQCSRAAKELVKSELEAALAEEDQDRVGILKRGAAFFTVAIMAVLLHERNGATFLNKVKPEVAGSNMTLRRLENYATIALEWYIEIINDLIETGEDTSSIVRSQASWTKIKARTVSKWKIFRLAKAVMEQSLPKL